MISFNFTPDDPADPTSAFIDHVEHRLVFGQSSSPGDGHGHIGIHRRENDLSLPGGGIIKVLGMTGDPDKHQTAQVGALPTPGGTEILMVPAGEKVRGRVAVGGAA